MSGKGNGGCGPKGAMVLSPEELERLLAADNWPALPLRVADYPQNIRQDVLQALADLQAFAAPPLEEPPAPLYAPARERRALRDDLPVVLGITGKPQSGKDVVAEYLEAHFSGVQRLAFSDAILEEVNSYLADCPGSHRITEQSKKLPVYRHLLQAWGLARRSEDADYWTRAVEARVQEHLRSGARLVLVTGVRTPDDIAVIARLGGEVVRVVRPQNAYRAEHAIEAALDHLPDSAFRVVENPVEGDLAPFEANIERLAV